MSREKEIESFIQATQGAEFKPHPYLPTVPSDWGPWTYTRGSSDGWPDDISTHLRMRRAKSSSGRKAKPQNLDSAYIEF